MEVKVIDDYITGVLEKRLTEFNLKEKYVKDIGADVKEQMLALLYHWNDIKFRKAMLILGLEEGKFYEPESDIDIKCFIVVTVRNSLIETIFSEESKKMELAEPLPETYIKRITMDSINYFKNINFEQLANEVVKNNVNDKYNKIAKRYPMAWEALVQLGNCNGKKVVYEEVKVIDRIKIDNLLKANVDSNKSKEKIVEDTQSGISEEFNEGLVAQINNILKDPEPSVFYVDSFKMLTRNFEKLLKVLEILLENGKIFLTSNYLISPSYIGKRVNIYKAAHNNKDVIEKLNNSEFLFGVSKTHLAALKSLIGNMKI